MMQVPITVLAVSRDIFSRVVRAFETGEVTA
mgnify:FL=1|jgi:hypothetical protein